MNKYVFALMVLAIVVSGCSEANRQVVDPITNIGSEIRANAWLDVRNVDLVAERSYSLSEYQEPVFVSIYGSSCDSCAQQHQELDEMQTVAYVLISTDRTQSAEEVLEHGLSATTSIASQELLRAIEKSRVRENDLVLVCPKGSYEVLGQQVYAASQLEVMAADCA